ncbi:uncharacterized protein DEA37_0009646 [Paragonimus westermani]|uniref:Uncharacterized protein n=1 Tax=Paragonimus westermani TaxID=34504 RepID=A0A5J4NZR5_9TREM|nr:uncharacterized protein DEA37_0009646 [Paragonimus westermani]
MFEILNETQKFLLDDNPDNVQEVEKEICRRLERLRINGVMSVDQCRLMKPVDTRTPHMYGLPKTHKPNVPLRPIMSMCNAPQHKLARWLADLLEQVRKQFTPNCRNDDGTEEDGVFRTPVSRGQLVNNDEEASNSGCIQDL